MERDWVVLRIDENRMWVTLSIKYPVGEEALNFSPEFIENYLHENGITAGINKAALQALSSELAYGQEIEVARGKPPVNGRDGVYNFMIPTEIARRKPIINADGSVDYTNSMKIAMIREGDLFAVYEPATMGEFGYTVFAEILKPQKGREQRPLRGKGFTCDEEKHEYRAAYDGRIVKTDDRINIEKIFVVKGDLDMGTGNLTFNGDVEIKGDVRSGQTVEADGDIIIHGHVGACEIKAGGSITIKKGVQGRNKCSIVAGKNVACRFVERCNIEAGDSIYADSVLDSTIKAYNKVVVTSRRGNIIGGITLGMQGIVVKDAGNDTGAATDFVFGVFKDELERYEKLGEEIKKLNEEIERLDKYMKVYETMEKDKRTKEKNAFMLKILRAKVLKNTEQRKLTGEIAELEESISRARDEAQLEIINIAHAGIKISVGKETVTQMETWKNIRYKHVNYEIKMLTADED